MNKAIPPIGMPSYSFETLRIACSLQLLYNIHTGATLNLGTSVCISL
jgi:hypothetical protein